MVRGIGIGSKGQAFHGLCAEMQHDSALVLRYGTIGGGRRRQHGMVAVTVEPGNQTELQLLLGRPADAVQGGPSSAVKTICRLAGYLETVEGTGIVHGHVPKTRAFRIDLSVQGIAGLQGAVCLLPHCRGAERKPPVFPTEVSACCQMPYCPLGVALGLGAVKSVLPQCPYVPLFVQGGIQFPPR